MWDWELLKVNSGKSTCEIISSYKNEDMHYTHSRSFFSRDDEFFLHNHSMYELEYYLSGNVVYMVNGTRYEIQPGSLLLIAPAVSHRLLIDTDAEYERHIMYISAFNTQSYLAKLAEQCLPVIENQQTKVLYYAPEYVKDLLFPLEDMNRCANSKDETVHKLLPVFAQTILSKILILSRTFEPTQYSIGKDHTLDLIKEYLILHLSDRITLQSVADRFNLNKDYCNRIFHKSTGMSIMQFLKYNRIIYARQLLSDGIPVSDVAAMVGYTDYSNFYKAYKSITGRIPSNDHQVSQGITE